MEINTINGIELVRGTSITPDEFSRLDLDSLGDEDREGSELVISLSTLENDIQHALESLNGLIDINRRAGNLNGLNERERGILNASLNTFSNMNGVIANEARESSVEYIANKIYRAIVTAIDLFIETTSRFTSWIKDSVFLSNKVSLRVSDGIRYLLANSAKGEFEIQFSKSEAEYFIIPGKEFSVTETLGLYTDLIERESRNTNKLSNIDKALNFDLSRNANQTYNVGQNLELDYEFDFPVLKEEDYPTKSHLKKMTGPKLPKGYVINAILPKDNNINQIDIKDLTEQINLATITVVKANNKENYKKIKDKFTKKDLEDINEIQLNFSNMCIDIMPYVREIEKSFRSLKRKYSDINYNRSYIDAQDLVKLNLNLAAINFVLRTIKEPFFTIQRMATATNNVLLKKLVAFIKKESKELSK